MQPDVAADARRYENSAKELARAADGYTSALRAKSKDTAAFESNLGKIASEHLQLSVSLQQTLPKEARGGLHIDPFWDDSTDAALSLVLADFRAANICLSATLSSNETLSGELSPAATQDALNKHFAREAATAVALRFDATSQVPSTGRIDRPGPDATPQEFKARLGEAIEYLITQAYHALISIKDAIKKIVPEDFRKGAGQLGELAGQIMSGAKDLAERGLALLKHAIESLTGLIGEDNLKKVGQSIEEIKQHIDIEGALKNVLRKLFGTTGIEERLQTALCVAPASAALNDTIVDFDELSRRFKRRMGLIEGIVAAASIAGGLLGGIFHIVTGPHVAVGFAVLYGVALAVVIATGMMYSGSLGNAESSLRGLVERLAPSSL